MELPQWVLCNRTNPNPLIKWGFFSPERLFNTWQPRMLEEPCSGLKDEGCTGSCGWRLSSSTWVIFLPAQLLCGRRGGVSAQRSSQLPQGGSEPPTLLPAPPGPVQRSADVSAPAPVPALHWQLSTAQTQRGRVRTESPDGLAETELGCLVSSTGGNEPEKGMCAYVGASAQHTHTES